MTAQIDLKNFVDKLYETFDGMQSKAVRTSLAEESIGYITIRTRLGYGVERDEAPKGKLKPLSPNYIKFRSRYQDLYGLTTPKKSNLTLTGQLLNSLKIKKTTQTQIIIGPSGKRYTVGKVKSRNLTNERLAEYVADAGRPFLHLSDLEVKKLEQFYRRTFADMIKIKKLI
jgi:hypothetical protein